MSLGARLARSVRRHFVNCERSMALQTSVTSSILSQLSDVTSDDLMVISCELARTGHNDNVISNLASRFVQRRASVGAHGCGRAEAHTGGMYPELAPTDSKLLEDLHGPNRIIDI